MDLIKELIKEKQRKDYEKNVNDKLAQAIDKEKRIEFLIELNQKLCEEQAETKKLIEESKNPKKFYKDLIFNFFLNIICSGIATILYEDYNSVLIFISIFFLTTINEQI